MMAEGALATESLVEKGWRVAAYNQLLVDDVSASHNVDRIRLDGVIASSESLLRGLGYTLPELNATEPIEQRSCEAIGEKSWDDLLAEASSAIPDDVCYESLLSSQEIELVLARHAAIGSELNWAKSINRYDVSIAVISGLISGLLDVFLVGVPSHHGFLGSKGAEGGWLSNLFKDKSAQILSPEKIRELEGAYGVSYDPSTNSRLTEAVAGLGPRTHRFQSLGHDPILGFIFGIKDQLAGAFTAIDKNGNLIAQQVGRPLLDGEDYFVRFAKALETQIGHMASDVGTKAGLPAPLMPLLLFLQVGKIGQHGYTVGELARAMYRQGYDFRHFMAGSVPVMFSEVVIRLSYFVRSINKGVNFSDAIPNASKLSIRRQLLIAHSVATLVNAGKVYVTHSPLALNWSQILTLFRYALPEVKYLIHGREAERSKLVNEKIMMDYETIRLEASSLLNDTPRITI